MVTPNAKVSGYVTPPTGTPLTPISRFGTGTVTYQSLDPAKISGHKYRVEFWDTEVDSVTPAGNPVHSLDSTTWERLTKSYSVRDESTIAEGFTSLDTLITTLKHRNIIPSTVVVTNQQGSVIPPASYRLNPVLGTIRGINAGDLPKGSDSIRYQYYPVLRSPNILLSPFAPETQDADIFDGVQLSFQNQWTTVLDGLKSRWTKTNAYTYTFSPLFTSITGPPDLTFKGFRKPSDYAPMRSWTRPTSTRICIPSPCPSSSGSTIRRTVHLSSSSLPTMTAITCSRRVTNSCLWRRPRTASIITRGT